MLGEGKEGDWMCSGCGNRNYAFRSFCNRCKQARLLVDKKTLADSKWLPRIGDWICTGCTNNNYASREKCKKCGQPKEIVAMPAVAMPGVSLATQAHYFARVQGAPDQNVNTGFLGNGGFQQSLPFSFNRSLVGADRYGIHPVDKFGIHPVSNLPLGGTNSSGIPLANQIISAPKGWHSGDWICNCGFHNYSSRTQCKKCNASIRPASPSSLVGTMVTVLGTKRVASEEFTQDWDSKRLNAGQTLGLQQTYPVFELLAGASSNPKTSVYSSYPSASLTVASNLQVDMQLPHLVNMPALPGKKEQSNGAMEIGCALIATITIIHRACNVIGARTQGRCMPNPLRLHSYYYSTFVKFLFEVLVLFLL